MTLAICHVEDAKAWLGGWKPSDLKRQVQPSRNARLLTSTRPRPTSRQFSDSAGRLHRRIAAGLFSSLVHSDMRNSTILAIITTATLTAAHGGIEGAHIYVPAAARAGRHRRLARRQPSRLSTDLASSTAIENSLPTAKPASVYVAPLAYANAAVPTALALQQDASSSNIFVSSNRYFGAAIACIAVICAFLIPCPDIRAE